MIRSIISEAFDVLGASEEVVVCASVVEIVTATVASLVEESVAVDCSGSAKALSDTVVCSSVFTS